MVCGGTYRKRPALVKTVLKGIQNALKGPQIALKGLQKSKCCKTRAGHLRDFLIFSIIKMIFCIFYQVNLTGSGLFK